MHASTRSRDRHARATHSALTPRPIIDQGSDSLTTASGTLRTDSTPNHKARSNHQLVLFHAENVLEPWRCTHSSRAILRPPASAGVPRHQPRRKMSRLVATRVLQ